MNVETLLEESPLALSWLEKMQVQDPDLARHSQAVACLSLKTAKKMQLSSKQISEAGLVGLLHDVGKLEITPEILHKQSPLTEEEREILQRHVDVGAAMVATNKELLEIVEAIRAEHEHWDGNGYPRGLIGTEIPLSSRIVAVCDAYDAITHKRPYSTERSHQDAAQELLRNINKQFDSRVVEAFLLMKNNVSN